MNTYQLALHALLAASCAALACDADSYSLGDEPPATTITTQRIGVLEGGYIEDIDVRTDGSTVARGFLGRHGEWDSGGTLEATWIGAFTPEGQLDWELTFPVAGDESLSVLAVAAGPDGSSFFSVTDSVEPELWKRSNDGTMLWSTSVSSPDARTSVLSLAATSDGGVIAAGAAANPNADGTLAWATRLDDQGQVTATRTWANDEGQWSQFASIAVADDGTILFGGQWGVSQFEADAWVVFVDADLTILSETKLPREDGRDSMLEVHWDEEGNAIAKTELHRRIVTLPSPTQELAIHQVQVYNHVWTPFSPTGHLVGTRSECGDDDKPGDCSTATIRAIDDGDTLWEHTFEDQDVMRVFAIDSHEALVTLYGPVSTGRHGSELHRLSVE